MPRILAVDFGSKRCGLACTDPLQMIVTGLDTVANNELMPFLIHFAKTEGIEKIIFGHPKHKDGTETFLVNDIYATIRKINDVLPTVPCELYDERFSSVQAKEIIFNSGAKKKKRQLRELVDKISAVVILQKYLGHI